MNQRFQEYKECQVVFVDHLDLGFEIRATDFVIEPREKKEKYNRAKVNQEFRRRINDDLERGGYER